MFAEQREPKVHLYADQNGRRNRGGKKVDNTLCASNHGGSLLTTTRDEDVTCQRCLKLLNKAPQGLTHSQIIEMLDETNNDLAKAQDLVELYQTREAQLENLIRFMLSSVTHHETSVVIHLPTQLTLGQLVNYIINDKVKTDDR